MLIHCCYYKLTMSHNSLLDLGYRDNEAELMDDNEDDDGDAVDDRS